MTVKKEEKISGWGGAGQGENPGGGVTVKLGAFSGWGVAGRVYLL